MKQQIHFSSVKRDIIRQ